MKIPGNLRNILLPALLACMTVVPAPAPAQGILITQPASGAIVPVGTRCTIGWSATNMTGQTVSIEVNGFLVADFVDAATGRYSWDIPWGLPASNACQVTLKSETSEPWTGPVFSMVSNMAPTLIARAPAGGEHWPRGVARWVSWEPHNLSSGAVLIELLRDGAVMDATTGADVANRRCQYAPPAGMVADTQYALRLSCGGACATSALFSITTDAPEKKRWTVLVYMDADNDLLRDMLEDVCNLGKAGSSSNINQLVQMDRIPGVCTNYGNWYDTKRFFMTRGMTPEPTNAIQDLGELDMAAPDTLTDFINWGVENYPADRYILICGNHGYHWSGMLGDYTPSPHKMAIRDVQAALARAAAKMTIFGLDMCSQGYVEVAHQFRDAGPQILIGSQYMEHKGWAYDVVFRQLEAQQGRMDNRSLAILLCNSFVDRHPSNDVATLSAVQLDKVAPLTSSLAAFSDVVRADAEDKAAIRAEAMVVERALHEAVLYCAKTEAVRYLVDGLNIYFPLSDVNRMPDYPAANDFAADGHWAAFVTNYLDHLTGTWIGAARRMTVAPGGDDKTDISRFLHAINPIDTNAWVTFAVVGEGSISPVSGVSIEIPKGQAIPISAAGAISTNGPPQKNHFVRWWVSGDVRIGDPLAATNTLTVDGDGLVMAFFSEDKSSYSVTFVAEGNGTISTNGVGMDTLTLTVDSGGNTDPVTASAGTGFLFTGWGGDHSSDATTLVITNVQSDMTVYAAFWPDRPTLTIQHQGSNVTLRWPSWTTDYVLESADDLASEAWTAVPDVTTNSVTLPLGTTNQYFRLRNPGFQ
jgi:uncharacterized repeat protein (TIGR02543 family)